MKLTCVTATFNAIKAGNREKLIRCVKSIAALTTAHEHLIYDGCSIDGTMELLKELESTTPGLKVVSEKDTGIYNALNKGLRDAKGEWFYVLGCDDYLAHSEALDNLLSKAPNADMISTPTLIDDEGILRIGGWKRRQFFVGMPYCHQGLLMRTTTAREFGGFDELYKIGADRVLASRFHLARKKIVFRKEIFGAISLGGISTNGTQAPITGSVAIAKSFGLTDVETECLVGKRQLPWRTIAKALIYSDSTVRIAGVFMLLRKVFK